MAPARAGAPIQSIWRPAGPTSTWMVASSWIWPCRRMRAIGVVYRPDTERQSHYFRGRTAEQFDAVVHIDETRAVEPLERTAGWERGEVPETYPFAV